MAEDIQEALAGAKGVGRAVTVKNCTTQFENTQEEGRIGRMLESC